MFINLMSPCNPLGYGVVGYNVLKELYRRGYKIGYFPIGNPTWEGDADLPGLLKEVKANADFFDPKAPCLKIWHQHDLSTFVGKGQRIAYPIFELDRFNEKEMHHLSSVDHLFVTSEWAKDVVESNEIKVPCTIIPLGVDTDLFYRDVSERNSSYWTKSKTIFINVGKWEKRKGHNELCEAFSKAFKPSDNVELWMLNHNPFIGRENEQWKMKYISSPMGANIKIIPRLNRHDDMRKLFNQVDCGVFPSKAEGWNLEILELMACGAHIIATNYSGHTEYLNEDNSFLLQPTGKEDAHDGKWFFGQGQWATIDVDDLAEKMRVVHNLKQSGELADVNENGCKTANQFSWGNTVNAIESQICVGV